MPRPTPQTWAHVERMHKWSLELGFIDGLDAAVEKMNVIIEDMNTVCPNESLPLHERIASVCNYYKAESKACPLPGRTTINFVVFPRAWYMKEIDPEGTMTTDQIQALTHDDIIFFAQLMDNPAKFDMDNPNMTWDEMLKLHYCFVMCEPNGQRWGRWVMWKCS